MEQIYGLGSPQVGRKMHSWFPLGSGLLDWASLVAQLVKNLPAMQETLV